MAFHGMTAHGATGDAGAARAVQPLPWPAAVLVIGTLSTGLWLGICWAVSLLF
jgi:hypothetical protein